MKKTRTVSALPSLAFSLLLAVILGALVSCERPDITDPAKISDESGDQENDKSGLELSDAPQYEPFIRIGPAVITKRELKDSFMGLYKKPKAGDDEKTASKNTLDLTALRNYLYLEALDRGLDVDPDISRKWNAKVTLWVGDYFMGREVSKVSIEDEITEALIPKNVYGYLLRTITVDSLLDAQRIRERVEKGEVFADLARQHSIDPSAKKDGKITTEQIMGIGGSYYGDEILEKLEGVETGHVSPPVDTPIGYTIFLVENRRELNDQEIERIRDRIERELRYRAVTGLQKTMQEKYPLKVDRDALALALKSDDEEVTVATTGDMDVTFGLLKGYSQLLPGVDIPKDLEVRSWLPALSRMSAPLAYRQEALAQAFLEEPIVVENIARAQKYALRETMDELLWKEAEPDEGDLYSFYINEVVPAGAEAIFSITAFASTEKTKVDNVAGLLSQGRDLKEAVSLVDGLTAGEIITGTFREEQLPGSVVMALEKTTVRQTTDVLEVDGHWIVYRLDGKDRGGAPSFDSFAATQARDIHRKRYQEQRDSIVLSRNAREPMDYIKDRSAIVSLIGEWLHLQQALRGISPPGGFHDTGERGDIVIPDQEQKPSGHP